MARLLDLLWQPHPFYWVPSPYWEQQPRCPESLATGAAAKLVTTAPTAVVQQPPPSFAATAAAVATSARLATERAFAGAGVRGSHLAYPLQPRRRSAMLRHIDASSARGAAGGD